MILMSDITKWMGVVMVWNFKKHLRPFKFEGRNGAVFGIDINPSGVLIASAHQDHSIRLWTNSIEAHSK